MKTLIILVMVILAIVFIAAVLYSVAKDKAPAKVKKNIQNHKVRFDAAKEQYFIVNELETYDEPVTNCFGFRVMYKEKPKAEFVCEKLNS